MIVCYNTTTDLQYNLVQKTQIFDHNIFKYIVQHLSQKVTYKSNALMEASPAMAANKMLGADKEAADQE
jgi:hypothetical protein